MSPSFKFTNYVRVCYQRLLNSTWWLEGTDQKTSWMSVHLRQLSWTYRFSVSRVQILYLLSSVLGSSNSLFPPQGTQGGGDSETLSRLNYRLEGLWVRIRVKARKGRQVVKQSKNITRCEILALELLSGVDLNGCCNNSSF